MASKMEMSRINGLRQNKMSRSRGRASRDGYRGSKPGGRVMRGRNRGGISRNRPARHNNNFNPKAFLGSSPNSAKLIVTNLDYSVTNVDIRDLFGSIGRLISSQVEYDRSGRSLGSAVVVFEKRVDAIEAYRQYNDVLLDNRQLKIQLVTSTIPEISYCPRISSLIGDRSKLSCASISPTCGRLSERSSGYGSNRSSKSAEILKPEICRNEEKPLEEDLFAELDEYARSIVYVEL